MPHPAVAQVLVSEAGTISRGSGTLIASSGQYGVIITNWHVVREARSEIQVVFSDGYQSLARVLKVDPDWDLAALLVWRPQVAPVMIAERAPRPGDLLTIAGYGSGPYRSLSGRCTQYVSPGPSMPYEMVELAAEARQGDSGGPIFNEQGELAGVLFGSSQGTTTGSFGGRVRRFLDELWTELAKDPLPADGASTRNSNLLAGLPATGSSPSNRILSEVGSPDETSGGENSGVNDDATKAAPQDDPPVAAPLLRPRFTPLPPEQTWDLDSSPARVDFLQAVRAFPWRRWAGETPLEQGKAVLAVVGVLLLLGHFSRWFLPARADS